MSILHPINQPNTYQYVGGLVVNGLSAAFLIRPNGQPQAMYNIGGTWGWTGLDDPNETPMLQTGMGVQPVGSGVTMCGLDSFGSLWAGTGTSMTAEWSWQKIDATLNPTPLTTFMGAGAVNGAASVFGLDAANNLWMVNNQGGKWYWTNLNALSGPKLVSFVDIVPLGQDGGSAVIGLDAAGSLWSCYLSQPGQSAWIECGTPAGGSLQYARYMGHLVVGGLISMFILTDGEVQACFNQGGVWKWQNLTTQPQEGAVNGPQLTTSMQSLAVSGKGGVYGLDIYGNLWAGTAPGMGVAWTWTQLNTAPSSTPLAESMGTGMVNGGSSVFGLDSNSDLWVCMNQGGNWNWTNLSNIKGGVGLRYFVGMTPLGQSYNPAVIGQDNNGILWTCCCDQAGNWYWYMCGNAPGALIAGTQVLAGDVVE